jgi:Family of unknown function (DUF6744)
MTMQEFREYKSHLSTLDESSFLGSLVMYTVSALSADYDQVRSILKGVGLEDCLPKNPPADSDVFRRVFVNGERRKIKLGEDRSQRLLVREVSTTHERLIKRIVAEDVDGQDVTLGYTECVEIEWNKNHPATLRVDELSPNADASQLARDLASLYPRERRHMDANAVRLIIQKALTKCNGTSVREGGAVYFVAQDYTAQLEALEKMSEQIDGCFVHGIPLVDDRKQRDFIREAFKQEATVEVQKMVAELINIERGGESVTPKRFAVLNKRYNALKSKGNEYSKLLEHEQGVTEVGLDVLKKHMSRLYSSVLADPAS